MKSLKNRTATKEEIVHDLALEVVRTSIEGYQRGNDYQVSDVDIARVASTVYDECYTALWDIVEQ